MINIAISGPTETGYRVIYTYPDKYNLTNSTSNEWLQSLCDPRFCRDFRDGSGVEVEDAFVLWKREHGNYYALIFPSKVDNRNGRMMITIHVGKMVFLKGDVIVKTLKDLKNIIDTRGTEKIDNNDVKPFVDSLENQMKPDNDSASQRKTSDKKVAYRVFEDEKKLNLIMQFPNQDEYRDYNRILIVPSPCKPSNESKDKYEEITAKIKVSYDISKSLPYGVSVDGNKYHYKDDDVISITYSKKGYKSQTVSFKADGQDNKYAKYNDTDIKLKSAEDAGIKFDRAIRFNIRSKNKQSSFRPEYVKIVGTNCNVKKESNSSNVFVFSDDIKEYKVKVSFPNFKTEELTLTEKDFIKGTVDVELTPERKEIRLQIDENKGKVYVDTDDPLYRILTQFGNYNGKLYTKQKADTRIEHIKSPSKMRRLINKIWSPVVYIPLMILLIFYCLYVIHACVFDGKAPWPFSSEPNPTIESPEKKPSDDPEPKGLSGEPELTHSVDPIPNQDNDKEVLGYMKAQDKWERKEMERSQKYVTLIDLIHNGQIDESIDHLYSTQTDNPCNGFWKGNTTSFVETVNRLKNSDRYYSEIKKKIEDAMRRHSDSNSVSLQELAGEVKEIEHQYSTIGQTIGSSDSNVFGSDETRKSVISTESPKGGAMRIGIQNGTIGTSGNEINNNAGSGNPTN